MVEEEKEEQDSEEMKPKFLQNIKIQELQQMKDIQGLLNIQDPEVSQAINEEIAMSKKEREFKIAKTVELDSDEEHTD